MIEKSLQEERLTFVRARLRLAQELLEESDHLIGREGYHIDPKRWFHPRHEREGLVCYLLLTCFDRLGQVRRFLTFRDWLQSKKPEHVAERNSVLDGLESGGEPIETACALSEHYQSLYGVKNAFINGVLGLPDEILNKLLSSIQVRNSPEHGLHGPGVSPPAYPLEDQNLERRLQLNYLYERRNRFTHRLEQHQRSSLPMISDKYIANGPAWVASIRDSRLSYWCLHQEHETRKSGGAYVYDVDDWPFVLFEVLYAGIGEQFHRTSIKLRFQVRLMNRDHPGIEGVFCDVEHEMLKDFVGFERWYWETR